MKCPACGYVNPDNAKFCENCGSSLQPGAGFKTLRLKCKNCDGIMHADQSNHILICPYCGSRELIVDSDAVALEKLRSANAREKEARSAEQKAARSFEKSIFRRVLIVFAVFALLFSATAFSSGYILCGLIGLVQTILNLTAWLTGMRIVKAKSVHLPRALFIIGLLLSIPFLVLFGESSSPRKNRNATYTWESTALTQLIDKPHSEKGKINTSSDAVFSMEVYDTTASTYKDYVNSCIEKGFTYDSVRTDNSYTAFDSKGTKLELNFYEYSSELSIRLSEPLVLAEMKWPSSGPALMLPEPAFSTGVISRESSYGISLYIGETSRTQFAAYVQECIDSGFNIDYTRRSDAFYGSNEKGDSLSLYYYGFQIMEINLRIKDPASS